MSSTRKFIDAAEVSKIDAMNVTELENYASSMLERHRQLTRERASDYVLLFYEHRIVYARHRQNILKG